MAEFKVGEHVWANFGNGAAISHVAGEAHEVAGADGSETKYPIQNPKTGEAEDLGYREPEGNSDTGRTFWKL